MTNYQNPITKEVPINKPQSLFVVWELDFGHFLAFGHWSLGF